MYGDQLGEFVCGYWGLKGERLERIATPNPWNRIQKETTDIIFNWNIS